MDQKDIIVIADSALFELGVSVGFGAVVGGFLAVALYASFSHLYDKIFPPKPNQ